MDSLRAIKNRIKSISNTSQITKAMEMVAASKMRKAQEHALESRFYTIKSLELLANLIESRVELRHYLLDKPETERICFLVIISDKGLCGGHNSAVLNLALSRAALFGKDNIDIVAVGKKGADFLKNKGFNVVSVFSGLGDYAKLEDIRPVAEFLDGFQKKGTYREVISFYSKFISTLKQTASAHIIAPFDFNILREIAREIIPETGRYADFKNEFINVSALKGEYIFEPSADVIIERLLPMMFELEVYYMILEANASEHSARMVAMKNASDNARDILGELKLIYNTARQAAITKELSEISAGAEALK